MDNVPYTMFFSPLKFFVLGLSTEESICLTSLLPTAEYENPFPRGKKVILYDKAKQEKWAAYANADGLVERLTVYADSDRKRDE